MYATIARMRLKPGRESSFRDYLKKYEESILPGHVATYVSKLDGESNTYHVLAVFENKALSDAAEKISEQDARFEPFFALLDGDPEWNEGEIVYAMAPDPVLAPA